MIGCGDPIKGLLRDEEHTHVVALLARLRDCMTRTSLEGITASGPPLRLRPQ